MPQARAVHIVDSTFVDGCCGVVMPLSMAVVVL